MCIRDRPVGHRSSKAKRPEHSHTHACTHARTHARAHARTHACTLWHRPSAQLSAAGGAPNEDADSPWWQSIV
eukprot:15477617-Alexandrium_andersonii.AAC.1